MNHTIRNLARATIYTCLGLTLSADQARGQVPIVKPASAVPIVAPAGDKIPIIVGPKSLQPGALREDAATSPSFNGPLAPAASPVRTPLVDAKSVPSQIPAVVGSGLASETPELALTGGQQPGLPPIVSRNPPASSPQAIPIVTGNRGLNPGSSFPSAGQTSGVLVPDGSRVIPILQPAAEGGTGLGGPSPMTGTPLPLKNSDPGIDNFWVPQMAPEGGAAAPNGSLNQSGLTPRRDERANHSGLSSNISTAPPTPFGLSSFPRTNLGSSNLLGRQQEPALAAPESQTQPSMVGNSLIEPAMGDMPVVGDGSDSQNWSVTNGCGCNDAGCATCNDCGPLGMPRLRGRLAGGGLRSRLGVLGGPISTVAFDHCGYISEANRYFQADALYWQRGDSGIVGTNFGGPADHPWTWGWRGTLGWRTDAIRGHELTYFGFLPMETVVNQNSPAGAIDARFVPGGGLTTGLLSPYYDATQTRQSLQTRFHSLEYSRVRFGWDVVKTSLGLRYMWLDDIYRLDSANGGLGAFEVRANNQLIGPDVGLELLYDVGRRISFSGKVKGGAYLDFYRLQSNLVSNGTQFIGNQNESTNLAASLELGANAYYRLSPHARLRGGYDALWLYNVLSATDNFPGVITPLTGFNPDDSRNVSLHGLSFGIEFYR